MRPTLFTRYRGHLTGLFTWLAIFSGGALAEGEPLAGKVVVLQISEFTLVEEAQTEFLHESLERANSEKASLVILEIEAPGGIAISTRQTMEKLGALDVPTGSLIKGEAVGGAALVALATDDIYFAEGSAMGASQPVEIEWRGPKDAMPDRLVKKTYADFAETMKSIAASKGHAEILVDGFIDPEIEVMVDGEVLSEADDVLILDSASEVANGQVNSPEDLIKAAGIAQGIVRLDYEPEEASEPEIEGEPVAKGEEKEAGDTEEKKNFGETEQESYTGKVVVIDVSEESLIRKTKFDFMRRILMRADEQGAEAVIFNMHTPGGYLFETRDLMNDLLSVDVPTYAFVNREASSAGSMISIATDKIYMNDPSTIGSSAIVAGGEGLDGTMKEKVESMFLDTVQQAAKHTGRDPDLCKAFVKIENEYYASIPVVDIDGSLSSSNVIAIPSGTLLSFGAEEGTQLVDGKSIFADGIVHSIEELMEKEGLTGEVISPKPLGFELVADWIVKIAPFLLLLGLAGVFLEVNSPGFGVPGITAAICFTIFFFGHHVAGKFAGFEVIGLFMIGIALLAIEIFIFPGVMVAGATGLLLIFGSLIFAMVDHFDFNPGSGNGINFARLLEGVQTPVLNLVIAMVGATILVILLMRYLPELPYMQKRMLVGVTSGGSSHSTLTEVSGGKAHTDAPELVSQTGVAHTDLRPSGKGMFGDRLLDVTSESEFVDKGTEIRIVEKRGGSVVVETLS